MLTMAKTLTTDMGMCVTWLSLFSQLVHGHETLPHLHKTVRTGLEKILKVIKMKPICVFSCAAKHIDN